MKKSIDKPFFNASVALVFLGLMRATGGVVLSTPVQAPAGTPVDSGIPVTITVSATPDSGSVIDTVNLIYAHNDGSRIWTVTNEMEWTSGTTYSAEIPPLPAGTVSYRVFCVYDTSLVVQSALYNFTVANVPGIATGRYMPFTTLWTRDGLSPSTNWYFPVSEGQWYGSGIYSTLFDTPFGGEGRVYLLKSIVGAYIQSPPLVGGVGTIYYTARNRKVNQTLQIHVQVATTEIPAEGDWSTVKILNFPKLSYVLNIAEPVHLNRADVKGIRFIVTEDSPYDTTSSKNDGAVAFDNIVFSYPPADIVMEERLRNPGYPARDQEVKMRVAVSDVNTNAPAVNHRVTVFYQWLQSVSARPSAGAWLSTNMVSIGGGVYEGVIPRYEAGYVHYYYKCEFDGYFYSRDPDGPTVLSGGILYGTEPENIEDLSPNYWSDGDSLPTAPVFYSKYQIRPFRSEYGEVWLDATPAQATVPMELVGDETWQGITLVTGIDNLEWYFVGLNRYTNDAATYQAAPVVWGENDQGSTNAPIGGLAEVDATNAVKVGNLNYEGFLLMRINTVDRDYIAKRAVYQNFDGWLASKTDFEESVGLYAVLKFDDDFDTWPADAYTFDQTKGEPFQNDTPSETVSLNTLQTANGWLRQSSRVVLERKVNNLPATIANQGLLLSKLHAGWVGNSGDSLTMGMEKLTYSLRASINDMNYAVYTNNFSFPHGQKITTVLEAAETSPEFPYISVVFSFQPSYFLGPSFYEFRLIQVNEPDSGQNDNHLAGAVWRWNAGSATPTQVGTTQIYGDGRLSVPKTVELIITGTSPVSIAAKVGSTTRTFTDNTTARLTSGGTVGFLTHDASPLITSLHVQSASAPDIYLNLTSFSALTGWYLGGNRADNGNPRWSKTVDNKLTRLVPTQTVSIWTAPRRPGATRPDVDDLVKHSEVTVNSLAYSAKVASFKQWNEGFVEVHLDDGDVDVVIDEPRLFPWRANTRGASGQVAEVFGDKYFDWTSTDQQYEWLKDERGWAVLEGIVTNATLVKGQDVHLERTRANPDLVQALVSPVLTNGIGIINFIYTVSGGQAIYSVDRTDEGVQRNWTTVAVFTNNIGATGTRYVPVRENYTGRIRVRLHNTSHPDAKLMIDDAEARDYPPRDDTTWQAYNVLVTDLQTNRLYVGQSAYLNNSASDGVGGTGVALTEHQPFIQSPSVGTGIGEIAFWFRSWDSGTPTVLTLKVAPTADAPDAAWKLVTNLTVAAGSSFVYFNNPRIYDLDNRVLRVYGDTNGAARICIDNILVTEPVRAGYEISRVRLVPAQPLVDAPVAVEVDIDRFLMNPTDIKIYVSYHEGSNVWGAANWWTREDTPGSRRVQLQPVAEGSLTYRTPVGAMLPALDIDQVMQYYAWGTHSEIEDPGVVPIFQNVSAFVHPDWYAPINLNTNFAAQGWSPYYFVYSCPPGSVWVNEVNPNSSLDAGPIEFIELIGPAQAHLGGWRLEMINHSTFAVLDSCTISNTVSLGSKTNGWGFFVWGDAGVANVNHRFLVVKTQNIPLNSGFHLIRSNGAVEQRLCWGTSARNVLEPLGYSYAGNKGGFSTSPLALRTLDEVEAGATLADFYWPTSATGSHTPGNVNDGQRLAVIGLPPAGYVWLTSAIGPNGRQDGTYITLIVDEVATGSEVSLLYAADPWYRIGMFKSNGADVPAAVGLSNYLWEVASMNVNISNHVTFVALDTYGDVPISYLSQWSEQAVAAGDGDPFSVEEEFLLNTDPTIPTTASLRVTDVSFSAGVLNVTVRLDRDNASKLGDINGTLYLRSRASLLSGEFETMAETAITGAQFNDGAGGDEYTYTFEGITDTSRFYQAIIQ